MEEMKGGEKKDKSTKRKMKTASQTELLEKTYAVEMYPTVGTRTDLSEKLGLTDRQLQMWFCHRRLKDKKEKLANQQRKEMVAVAGDEVMVDAEAEPESVNEVGLGSGWLGQGETRRGVGRSVAAMPMMGKMHYESRSPQLILEQRAIAFVESQLGELVREDGPVLGVEFDPLPPDAFGAPLAITEERNQTVQPYDSKISERQDAKSIKTSSFLPSMEHCFVSSSSGGKRKPSIGSVHVVHPQIAPRALHEYYLHPEQPIVRADTYDRATPSHLYDIPVDAPSGIASTLGARGSFLHGNEQVAAGYSFQGQVPNVSLLSQQGRHGHAVSSASTEYGSVPHKNSLTEIGIDVQFGSHPITGLENPFESSNGQVSLNEDASRMERKRKNEEGRTAREVEAHEKRMRKELEKQDILRRKREEQMRREMEKHDRERQKEEERLLREKQREEERFQREQRRESERRERFLQKETLRAEKMRQKDEQRREKEAARLKTANERATARRIARESMELIEDEQLELMELAASSKGLPSIISLDSDTLQNLDLFRDMLTVFPPKSVSLKRPFAVHPWTDSEENIGNVLMVWRFLITFADALELWPFTLDEFVQAFHDYDPRLLGEIHVALLRSIIKDIEYVARTPSIGLGVNQHSAANPGGGHPQIVEGAYAWGFDICSWQLHLNPLTWPEILREFALSAGFGPQLTKRSVPRAYFRDDNEGHDGEDIVSTLRNGSAAETAFARMRERGFSQQRRCRHRLTPGTVKFAAFHVLSLEGGKGLTILEVADKIQKSGLRDLTTSKTPEASIAAALSRDGTLFERTAPSTYCVRPAFRKDPADADAVLSAAREKVQIFQSRFSDSEEAEKDAEDADDVEKDDGSESDGAEDPEFDDLGALATPNKGVLYSNDIKCAQEAGCSGNGKGEAVCDDITETPHGLGSVGKSFSPFPLEGSKNISSSRAINGHPLNVDADQEDIEIDESNTGEPWVQGLMEGEYSDLSVEERLNALVALISVAIEGNSIHVILEERLEAATSLKKQMWAEAQLDKRRLKEEHMTKLQYSSFVGTKAETNLIGYVDGDHSPLPGLDNKGNEESLNHAAKQGLFSDLHSVQSNFKNMSTEKNMLGHEFSMPSDNFPFQQYNYAAEKSRSQLKSYISHQAEEMYVYRSLPLGQDRRRNRYWQFATSSSRNDPGSGRIFLESHDGCWRLIDSVEAFDALLASLDTRGIRESHLHSMLRKIEMSFKETIRRNLCCTNAMNPTKVFVKDDDAEMAFSKDCSVRADTIGSTVCCPNSDELELSVSFRIELGRNNTEKNDALKRYQDLQIWLWKECFNTSILCALKYGKRRCSELLVTCDICHNLYLPEEKHCSSCHKTFATIHNLDVKFTEHVLYCEKQKVDCTLNIHASNFSLPTRIQMLKAQLALIEAYIPIEALQPVWTEVNRKSWGVKLHSSSSAEDLFQLLTLLECSVKRDCLSSKFETTKELLGFSTMGYHVNEDASLPASVPVLPWIPQSTAAVALRLMEFDASIAYMLQQKVASHKDKEAGEFIKLPSRYAVKNIQELEPAGTPEQEEIWADPGSERNLARGRGRRGRGRGRSRGGRLQRGSGSSKIESGRKYPWNSDKAVQRQGWRTRTRGRGRGRGRGRMRGRRTVRRQKPESRMVGMETALGGFGDMDHVKQKCSGESPRSSGGEELDGEETGRMYVDEQDDNIAGTSESDDNGQASGDEYDDRGGADYTNGYDGKFEGLMDDSEEDDVGDAEGEGDGDGGMDEDDGDGDGEDGNNEDGDASMDEDDGEDGDGGMDEDDGDVEGNGDEGENENGDEDEGTASMSTDYSD